MTPLSKEQHSRLIDVAKNRFYNRIELYELYLWLDNFEPDEYDLAITVLEHVDFYRENDFVSLLESAMSKLPINIDRDDANIHFLPIGEPGKSGNIVLYQLHKLFTNNNNCKFYNYAKEIEIDKLGGNDYIVMADDFCGSGTTVDEFIKNIPNSNKILKFPRLYLIFGIIMQNALNLLIRKYSDKYGTQIAIGDIKYKAFNKGNSPFGGYVRMKQMRDFCYKYGNKLCKKMPLGYKNTQSLVIIEHSSPNDSLPILWYNNKSWKPLAPRSYREVAEKACTDRKDNNRWISMVRKNVGVGNNEDIKGLFSNDNYTMIMILRLLMDKKTESVIANTLGLTYEDMQHMKEMGVIYGYWNEKWEVSEYATKQYTEAVAYFRRQNKEKKEMAIEYEDDRNMIYVPETFRSLK